MRKIYLLLAAGFSRCRFRAVKSWCRARPTRRGRSTRPFRVYALSAPILSGAPGITLKCLVQPQDGCLRNYELSDWDAALLGSADAAILSGRGLESFESGIFGGRSRGRRRDGRPDRPQ